MKLVKILLSVVIVFLLVALGVTAFLGPDALRFCGQPSSDGKCRKADAIVVVSGGDTMARTDEAVELYKAGWAPIIIFSGAAADKSGPSNARVMQDRALASGVPYSATMIEETSTTTNENAENTMILIRQNDITSIILVTSAYHQRRALLEFQYYGSGIDVRPHPVAEDKDWNRFWWLSPWGWNLAISEIIKSGIAGTGGVDRT